jgi:signal transduction histidine kinase
MGGIMKEIIDDNSSLEDIRETITNINVHASIIKRLGEELIADEITAFSELIKNAYDADSPWVKFEIDSKYSGVEEYQISENHNARTIQCNVNGMIKIEDAGIGMSYDDIMNGWLTIANSMKKKMRDNKSRTKKFHRYPLGEKGLGRLSLQRLGLFSTLITKQEGSQYEYTVQIPWMLFEDDYTIEEIPIRVVSKLVGDIETGYTKIIVTGLKNKELWEDGKRLNEFEKGLMQITSPFDTNYTFRIYGLVNGKEFNSELISKKLLERCRSSYKIRFSNGQLDITGKLSLGIFLRGEYTPNIDEIVTYFNSQYFKANKHFKLDDSKSSIELEIDISNVERDVDGLFNFDKYNPGDFDARIYDFNLDSEYFKQYIYTKDIKILENLAMYRNAIKYSHGIYVIRDGFTIMPYGFDGKDWLNISTSANTRKSVYSLKNDNLIGFIELDSERNVGLQEKTDREGFINNTYYLNFIKLLEKVNKEINNNIEKLLRGFNDFKKEKEEKRTNLVVSSPVQAVQLVDKGIQTLKTDSSSVNNENSTEQLTIFKQDLEQAATTEDNSIQDQNKKEDGLKLIEAGTNFLKNTLNELSEKLEQVVHLAGLGLIAESLTHDMSTSLNNLEVFADKTRLTTKDGNVADVENLIDYVKATTRTLRRQLLHIAPSFMVVKDKREHIDVKEYIRGFFNFYEDRAQKYNIKLNLIVHGNFDVLMNRGQLNQVFDNLYLNSEYWLKKYCKSEHVESCEFNVELFDNKTFHIWDTGYGISNIREEDLFYPFATDKEDGRGLGLYIVQTILYTNNAEIILLQDRNEQFHRRYKFEVRFLE